jgi:hypothetical protein
MVKLVKGKEVMVKIYVIVKSLETVKIKGEIIIDQLLLSTIISPKIILKNNSQNLIVKMSNVMVMVK